MGLLVACDMDGTLLDPAGSLPGHTVALFQDLLSRGASVALTTGRRVGDIRRFVGDALDSIDCVACNGSHVLSEGEELLRDPFAWDEIDTLQETIHRYPFLHLVVFSDDGLIAVSQSGERTITVSGDDGEPMAIPAEPIDSIDRRALRFPDKLSVSCEIDAMDASYLLGRYLGDNFMFPPSSNSWIEVVHHGDTKAQGITRLLDRRGMEWSDVIAFGDSLNDLEMIECAGVGCAMRNGHPILKAIADRVIGDNGSGAVQRELGRLLDEGHGRF